MLVFFHETLHKDRFRSVVLQELLHLRWELLRALNADGMHTHRLREHDKVGVRHLRVGVTFFVEEIYIMGLAKNGARN